MLKSIFVTINLASLGIILYACVSLIGFNNVSVDIDLNKYVESYKGLLKEHCPGISFQTNYKISLSDKLEGENWIGVCKRSFNSFEIEIDKEWFLRHDEEDRRQLMYHELAHCFLFKDHSDSPFNYMFFQFVDIKESLYTTQAIYDIKEYCLD